MAKLRNLGPNSRNLLLGGALILSASLLFAQDGSGDSGKSIGFVASKDASAKDVGLPVYPGAKLAPKDSDGGDATGQIGLWGGSSGFKLVFVKLESNDSSEKVAAFYRSALAKYGKVLECTGTKSPGNEKHSKNSNELTCDDQHDESGIVLKSGTEDKQHIVGIEKKEGRTVVQLIYLVAHGDDKKI